MVRMVKSTVLAVALLLVGIQVLGQNQDPKPEPMPTGEKPEVKPPGGKPEPKPAAETKETKLPGNQSPDETKPKTMETKPNISDIENDIDRSLDHLYGKLVPWEFAPVSTKIGDIATGVIIIEAKNELYLDAKPCTGKIVTFHTKFSKKKLGTVKCGVKTFDTYQIEQK